MLIDSHCHLYMGSWENNLKRVLLRAQNSGVNKIICPGINIKTSRKAVNIANNHDGVYAAAGIHPHNVDKLSLDFIKQLTEILTKPKIVALGEIGLDYFRNYSDVNKQREVFRQQLFLAQEMNLPVIIHNRNADQDVIKTLKEIGEIRGVAHCFSSDLNTAKILLDLGFYISFAGNLTYKNSSLFEVAKEIQIDRLLIETDAPFLTPTPFRGKENEPSNVKCVAEKLADCKKISFEEIAVATSKNARNLFKLSIS